MNMKRKWAALFLCLLMLLPFAPVAAQSAQPLQVERIFAEDRYLTSYTLSYRGFTNASVAVISSGANFPDALAGGQLAGYMQAPLLITRPDGVSEALRLELRRLGVKTVYLLGGTAALSERVESTLKQNYRVVRLAGNNRLETSQAIIRELTRLKGNKSKTYYAAASNFPDALAAGPLVVKQNGYLHLNGNTPVTRGIAIGGETAVPGRPSTRIAGANRYETAAAIARAYPSRSRTVLVASGTNYPDALSAAGFAAKHNYPILLTHPDSLSPATAAYLKEARITKVIVLGGTNAVSERVLDQIRHLNMPPVG